MTSTLRTALLSVHDKSGLAPVVQALADNGVRLLASGGTARFIREMGLPVEDVADWTGFPEILDGRVKTLHPRIFGGILAQRASESHAADLADNDLPLIDYVIVDLYPFAETLRQTTDEAVITEQIDIGGVALLRAAAKNHTEVVVVPGAAHFAAFAVTCAAQKGAFTAEQRQKLAAQTFDLTATYDRQIADWLGGATPLRYGENPHQPAKFVGDLSAYITQLSGKALSYNNLLDLDAALSLVQELEAPAAVIVKHATPCGIATGPDAWARALACDPVSAFGGVIALSGPVPADSIDKHFFEVLGAPELSSEAVTLLQRRPDRILLTYRPLPPGRTLVRSALNGVLTQAADEALSSDRRCVTDRQPESTADLRFGEIATKYLKSNAIALVRNGQLIGAGTGQTSRVDAFRQAVDKARRFGFSTEGAVLASDGFFPFDDIVQEAHALGIRTVLQPGGSKRDEDSIRFCNAHDMCMIFTGLRHFRH